MFHISNHIIDLERTPVLRFILANLSEPLVFSRPVLFNCCWGIGARLQCWLAWLTARYLLKESWKATGTQNVSALIILHFSGLPTYSEEVRISRQLLLQPWLIRKRWKRVSWPNNDQECQFYAMDQSLRSATRGQKGGFKSLLVLAMQELCEFFFRFFWALVRKKDKTVVFLKLISFLFSMKGVERFRPQFCRGKLLVSIRRTAIKTRRHDFVVVLRYETAAKRAFAFNGLKCFAETIATKASIASVPWCAQVSGASSRCKRLNWSLAWRSIRRLVKSISLGQTIAFHRR